MMSLLVWLPGPMLLWGGGGTVEEVLCGGGLCLGESLSRGVSV